MSIQKDVEVLNNLFQVEESTILGMAQEIYRMTLKEVGEHTRLKRPYWQALQAGGCRYSVNTLILRCYTIDVFPGLMAKKSLNISFYIYQEIALRKKLLGKWEIRNIKMKAEKGLWTVARARQEINRTLRKKGVEVHVCTCDKCGNIHKKNGGVK